MKSQWAATVKYHLKMWEANKIHTFKQVEPISNVTLLTHATDAC